MWSARRPTSALSLALSLSGFALACAADLSPWEPASKPVSVEVQPAEPQPRWPCAADAAVDETLCAADGAVDEDDGALAEAEGVVGQDDGALGDDAVVPDDAWWQPGDEGVVLSPCDVEVPPPVVLPCCEVVEPAGEPSAPPRVT